jgi:NADH-quinone oxidoreductase subunit I
VESGVTHLPGPIFNAPGHSTAGRGLPTPSYDTPQRGPQKEKRLNGRPTLFQRLIVPGLLRSWWSAVRHIWQRKFTIQWPEETREVSDNYRGMHRLNKDDRGRMKCVACFLCQTACPANCIRIEAGKSPWPDREKYAVRFTIDELRCVFCGMCEEACPEDAIELTRIYSLVGTRREEMVYDKEQLLAVYDLTRDQKHPLRW